MKYFPRNKLTTVLAFFFTVTLTMVWQPTCDATYLKMDPPADVDKTFQNNNNSCYLATAANMLAGAGYGNGNTLQARADNIYGNLTAHFGTANSGWTDTALSWWLSSAHNTWTTNPYTVVTVYGNKLPKNPWADANGARFIGNELRSCNFVGLSISWPTNATDPAGNPIIGAGGHAITGWGDSGSSGTLTANPASVVLTDSDNDTGGNVQTYTYDAFTNPNPGGANEGNGWYFNYDPNHPYIKHIVMLSPVTVASGNKLTQRVVGSYNIHQDQEIKATDLHYEVGTDVNILSYKTTIDWATNKRPVINEGTPPLKKLTVDWDFSDKPVPYCTWVTTTTEFVLPSWNAINYSNVHFTYPQDSGIKPRRLAPIKWEMKTPIIKEASRISNVTGGYVVGSFDIIDPARPLGRQVLAKYRFIHEYSYNQAPEEHLLLLTSPMGATVANLRFGHSYGYLDTKSLWKFENWMTMVRDQSYKLGDKPIEVKINWRGRLPYPKGEDIKGRIRDIKQGLSNKPLRDQE